MVNNIGHYQDWEQKCISMDSMDGNFEDYRLTRSPNTTTHQAHQILFMHHLKQSLSSSGQKYITFNVIFIFWKYNISMKIAWEWKKRLPRSPHHPPSPTKKSKPWMTYSLNCRIIVCIINTARSPLSPKSIDIVWLIGGQRENIPAAIFTKLQLRLLSEK